MVKKYSTNRHSCPRCGRVDKYILSCEGYAEDVCHACQSADLKEWRTLMQRPVKIRLGIEVEPSDVAWQFRIIISFPLLPKEPLLATQQWRHCQMLRATSWKSLNATLGDNHRTMEELMEQIGLNMFIILNDWQQAHSEERAQVPVVT